VNPFNGGDIEPRTNSRSPGGGTSLFRPDSADTPFALHASDASLAPDFNQLNDSAGRSLDKNGECFLT